MNSLKYFIREVTKLETANTTAEKLSKGAMAMIKHK